MRRIEPSERKVVVGFSLSRKSVEIMDENRGHEKRSSFIDRLIREQLSG